MLQIQLTYSLNLKHLVSKCNKHFLLLIILILFKIYIYLIFFGAEKNFYFFNFRLKRDLFRFIFSRIYLEFQLIKKFLYIKGMVILCCLKLKNMMKIFFNRQ